MNSRNKLLYKFSSLFKTQYSNMLEYRAEIALWAISGIIPFFMLNIWTNNELHETINLTSKEIARYFLSAFFVRQFSVVWVVFTFEEDSLLGKISPYLLQPLHPFSRYLFQHIAEQITRFPFALIISIVFFTLNPDSFWLPSLGIFFISLLSTFMSFLIQFLMQSIIACFCFWTEKASSLEKLLFIPTLFLSGLLAPVRSFPVSIKSWVYLTPFPYLIDLPANILSGNKINIFSGLAIQLVWILLFYIIFNMIWKIGSKKYTAMGL